MNSKLEYIKVLCFGKVFCILCLLNYQAPHAAWRSSGGPEGGNISSIIAVDSLLIAGANPGGIYRSRDMGESWQFVGGGTRARFITNIDTLGSISIASAKTGGMQQYALSFSYDKGATWNENKNIWPFMGIEAFTVHENSIFVKVLQGVLFRSDDTAKTWISLEKNVPGGQFLNINKFYSYQDTLLAATNGGVMYTADNGQTWVDISKNLPDTAFTSMQLSGNVIYSVAADDGTIFVGTRSAVYSLNGFQSQWKNVMKLKNDVIIHSLLAKKNFILAGTYNMGVYRSSNRGNSWQENNQGTLNPTWNCFVKTYDTIFAGTDGDLYKSTNNGDSWKGVNTGILAMNIYTITNIPEKVYAGSWGGGVYQKNTNTWTQLNEGLRSWSTKDLMSIGTQLYASEIGTGIFKFSDSKWEILQAYNDSSLNYRYIRDISYSRSNLFIGASGGFFMSTDSGRTIFKVAGSDMIVDVNCLYNDPFSDDLMIGSNEGIFKYNTIKNTMSDQLLGHLTYAISGNHKSLFAGAWRQGVLRSNDNGETWTKTSLQLPTNVPVVSLACIRDSIFAGTDGLGVFFSSDNGDTWQEFNDGLTCPLVKVLHIHDGILYAGTNGGSVFEVPLAEANATINLTKHLNAPRISAIAKKNSIRIQMQNYNEQELILTITDIAGRTIYRRFVQSNQELLVPLPLATKTYLVQIKGRNIDYRTRLLTVK